MTHSNSGILRPDSHHRYDVVIAGAGLAGASLGLQIARQGIDVAILDASTFPRDKLCGEFLSPECGAVFDRLGLLTDIESIGYHPIRRIRITTPNGRAVDAEIAPEGTPAGFGLSRSALDALIVSHARSAGTAVFEGIRVVGPIIEEGRVVGVSGRDAQAKRIDVRARVVIAADGRHSKLVEETGRVRNRSLFRPRSFGLKRHFHIHNSAANEPEGTVGLHLVPGGYAGTGPVEGGLLNLCALLPESSARSVRGDLDRLAADQLARNPALARLLAAGRPAGPWKTVAGVRVEAANPIFPGILFAGDCQGTVDPLGGQGMTMALLGAELLAPFVGSALVAETADSTIQRAYRSAWHLRFDRRIALCQAFHHILIHPGLIDFASRFGRNASRLLSACYARTRDRP